MHKKIFRKTGAALLASAMVFNTAVVSSSAVTAADETRFEFEDAVITGDVTVESNSASSGGSYLKMADSGTISLTLNADETGMYNITIYGGGIGGAKQQNLSINGTSQGALAIPESTGFEAISVPAVKLNKGENTLLIEKSWGWSQFDYVTVEPAELAPITASQITPCDPNATAETQSLMNYFSRVYGNNIISGQQEIYKGGAHDFEYEFEYLNDLTGHYPAIRGFDYGNFCCPAFGSDDGSTERVVDWVKNRGGIATASFHLNVPTDFASYTIGSRINFDDTTYSEKTDFSPSKAATEGTKENEYYVQALTTLAAEFNELEEQGIPVLWRPLHEAEGGGGETGSWFWWGSEGSAAYKKLWQYTYDKLTNDFGCHNLIWEWNSYNFKTSENWYPGDEYVDIIGYDKYSCTVYLEENNWQPSLVHNDSAISSIFYSIMEKYDSKKMVAMAENDSFSTVENLTAEKAGWLYFCTWYDNGNADTNFLTNPIFNTKEDTIEMYQSDYCITLDELPADLYTKEITPPDPGKTTTTKSKPITTTTTTTTAPVPEGKEPALVDENGNGEIIVKLPRPADIIYMNIELPDEVTYANGCLGASIEIDGKYYWVNSQWETTKSGLLKFNPAENIYNITLTGDDKDYAEDETILAAVKESLAKTTTFNWQKWYAQNAAGKEVVTDEITLLGAYVDSESVTPDIVWGDADCDGKIYLNDAVLVMQAIGNPDSYGVNGTEETHITEQGKINSDVSNTGDDLTNADALAIQKYLLQMGELPEKAE